MDEQKSILKKDVKDYLLEAFQFYKQKSQVAVAVIFVLMLSSFFLVELWNKYLLEQIFGNSDLMAISNQMLDMARTGSVSTIIEFFSPNANLYALTLLFSILAFIVKFFLIYIYATIVLKDYRSSFEITEKKYFTFSKIVKTLVAFFIYELLVSIISGGVLYVIFMYFILLRLMMYLPSILDGDRGVFDSFSKSSEFSRFGGVKYRTVVSMFFAVLLLVLFVSVGMSFLENTNIYLAVSIFFEVMTTLMTIKLSIILYYDIKSSLITDYGLNDNK